MKITPVNVDNVGDTTTTMTLMSRARTVSPQDDDSDANSSWTPRWTSTMEDVDIASTMTSFMLPDAALTVAGAEANDDPMDDVDDLELGVFLQDTMSAEEDAELRSDPLYIFEELCPMTTTCL